MPPSFPDWDGQDSTKRIWLEKIECFKEAPYFSKVLEWSRKVPATEDQSRWIRKELIQEDRVPAHIKATIMNVAEFKVDGFKMLSHLIKMVTANSTSSMMKAVRDIVALEQAPGKTSGVFMSRVQDIDEVVGQIKVADVLPLFALASLDTSRYPCLMMRYIINEKGMTSASIRSLEKEMIDEEGRAHNLNQDDLFLDIQTHLPGAKRAGAAKPATATPVKPPFITPGHPPPTAGPPYPPAKSIDWNLIKEVAAPKNK